MKNFSLIALVVLVFSTSSFAEEVQAPAEPDTIRHESELSIAATSGNSDAQTYQARQTTSYHSGYNVFRLGAHYLYGRSQGLESAKNWDATLRYERYFTEDLGAYVGNGYEGDIFVGYDHRISGDLGARYYLIPGDKKIDYLVSEAGYRIRYEHHVAGISPTTLTNHFLRGYLEGVYGLTDRMFAKAWVEVLPDLSGSGDFQTNFEISLSVALTDLFSLKVGYQGNYRKVPISAGRKTYDSLLTSGLLAKF